MFHLLRISFFSLLVYLSLAGCEKKESGKVKITVALDSAANQEVKLFTPNLLNLGSEVLATTRLDSNGNGAFEISLEKPMFAFIEDSASWLPVFIIPGDQQEIRQDSSRKPKYNGDGADLNRYIQRVNIATRKYQVDDYRQFAAMDLKGYQARRDSLKNELAGLLADFEKDKKADVHALQIMRARNNIITYKFTQSYINAQFGYDPNDKGIPSDLKAEMKAVPQDSLALASNMYDYGLVLAHYLQSEIIWSASDRMDSSETDSSELDLPTFAQEEIEINRFIRPLEEHLKASNIMNWLNAEGLSKETDILWAKFQKQLANPLYKKTIQKSFDQWAAIAPGKPAPDFTGSTADGKNISLSSLKGKLVYVDVWATWCGPCREEFPHSKKLMKAFEGNDKIAFLYVSTDENIDAWKKLLSDKSVPAGIHINHQEKEKSQGIWEKYLIRGIPRYFLIDAEGKMLKTHAPRPSFDETLPLLKSLLKES